MADDNHDSKTEEPTEKKLSDAIEKGDVPTSREAALFASIAAAFVATALFMRSGAIRFGDALSRLIDNPAGWSLETGGDAVLLLQAVGAETARFLLPILLLFTLAGLVASFAQNPPSFVLDRLMPDLSRLSLGSNWSRIFGAQGLTEFAKGTAKFAAVTILVVMLLRAQLDTLINGMFGDAELIPDSILSLCLRLMAALAVATLVIFTADLVWARIHWRNKQRMSRQDVKDEMKQAEGDPLVKARLRSLRLDRSRQKMLKAVPTATLVIANPTHYAIALRYKREEGGAPLVLAKGQDYLALKIRALAEENNVPVVEDKALARSLYDKVTVDKMIPPEFFRAVAETIHFLNSRKAGTTPRVGR